LSIELSTPDKAGSSEETRGWELPLDEVRRQGPARQGLGKFYRSKAVINALSAPVLDANGEAVLALTAVGEANRFGADLGGDFARALWETAANLSRRLGHGFDAGEPASLPNNAYRA
jgi:DNA-binding IclR family transcriptional regulator